MTKSDARTRTLYRWFLDSLDTTQETEGALRNALLDLRHMLQGKGLSDELRSQLDQTVSVLEQVAGRLTILQESAGNALNELRESVGEAPACPLGPTGGNHGDWDAGRGTRTGTAMGKLR